ncbi:MAG: hypothetical protein JWQ71_3343 [Pedosphaera sp.]|nr:hypothetical protein [Pedosphaera sp.]
MNKLRDFYIKSLTTVALVLAMIAYVVAAYAEKHAGENSWTVILAKAFDWRPVLVAVIAIFEWLIRKKIWKWVHPELDFSGQWKGHTKYTHVRAGTGSVPFEVDQEVMIVQDCLNLRLLPSIGVNFRFSSRAIDIQNDGMQLVYAYHVEYAAGTPNRPLNAYGYEWLDVVNTPEGKRPQQLDGNFAHCAFDQTPVYSGEVHLVRINKHPAKTVGKPPAQPTPPKLPETAYVK